MKTFTHIVYVICLISGIIAMCVVIITGWKYVLASSVLFFIAMYLRAESHDKIITESEADTV